MAKPHHQLLAESLARAKKISIRGIVFAKDLARYDLERLEKSGWLIRILRGWYLFKQPQAKNGESTAWYSSFWNFVSVYLQSRFKDQYCLSASDSLRLHIGSTIIPQQLLIMAKTGGSSVVDLPFKTSIVIYQETKAFPNEIEQVNGINVMSLAESLHRIPPVFFRQHPEDTQIALKLVDPISLSRILLTGSNIAAAQRIIGAYNFLKNKEMAKRLLTALTAAGYQVQPENPFTIQKSFLSGSKRIRSPYTARILLLWEEMRLPILDIFPDEPGLPKASKKYFDQIEKIYVNDAYNSLSIEGYEVSEELIEKIAKGEWDPEQSADDKQQINAMAAKGYRETFKKVLQSIDHILHKKNSGKIIKRDLYDWYSALFSPSVKAGILTSTQLAGYRTHQVFIRNSMHTPLPVHALVDAMDTFFDCIIKEPSAAVRAVLGHFIFVFIHPYMDGNGRIGRFIMNSLFASGGFPWTVVRVANRDNYLKTLEKASVAYDISPFAKFILQEMLIE